MLNRGEPGGFDRAANVEEKLTRMQRLGRREAAPRPPPLRSRGQTSRKGLRHEHGTRAWSECGQRAAQTGISLANRIKAQPPGSRSEKRKRKEEKKAPPVTDGAYYG